VHDVRACTKWGNLLLRQDFFHAFDKIFHCPPAEGRRDRSAKLEFSVDRRFHAYEVYAFKVHVREVHAHEVHAREVHAREMYAYEVHTCEMHACEVHAREMRAREVSPPRPWRLNLVLALRTLGFLIEE
jgi:hypothetical protein